MRQTKKAIAKYAGASALALLIATSAFAAPARWQGRPGQGNAQPAASVSGRTRAVSNVPIPQNARQSAPQQQRGTTPSTGWGSNSQNDRRSTPPQPATMPAGGYGSNGQSGRQLTPPQRGTTPAAGYGSYRENDRVNRSGRITSFSPDRDGYRVQLDHGNSFWIPSSRLGNRARDLRIGVSISLGGIFREGMINVDAVSWPGVSGYDNGVHQGYVSGVVESIDYRSGVLMLRDDTSGRVIEVDMPRMQGRSVDLRLGDYVTLSGNWAPGNVFAAYRIDAVNNGGY